MREADAARAKEREREEARERQAAEERAAKARVAAKAPSAERGGITGDGPDRFATWFATRVGGEHTRLVLGGALLAFAMAGALAAIEADEPVWRWIALGTLFTPIVLTVWGYL